MLGGFTIPSLPYILCVLSVGFTAGLFVLRDDVHSLPSTTEGVSSQSLLLHDGSVCERVVKTPLESLTRIGITEDRLIFPYRIKSGLIFDTPDGLESQDTHFPMSFPQTGGVLKVKRLGLMWPSKLVMYISIPLRLTFKPNFDPDTVSSDHRPKFAFPPILKEGEEGGAVVS